MDAGNITVDLTTELALDPKKFAGGIAEAKRQIRSLEKSLADLDTLRKRVSPDIWNRSAARQQVSELEAAKRAALDYVAAEKQAADAIQRRRRLLGGGLTGSRAGRFGLVGLAGYAVGQNLQDIGGENSGLGRAGAFVSNLSTLNFAGAFKAARDDLRLTKEEIQAAGTSSTKSAAEFNQMVDALASLGARGKEAAGAIREIRNELNATNALNYYNAQYAYAGAPTRPDDRGGMQGPGAVAYSNTLVESRPKPPAPYGLSTRLQTAIAGARATGTEGQLVAQLRRAQRALKGQVDRGLPTDQARLAVFGQLDAVQSEIAALTKKPKADFNVVPLALEKQLARAQATVNVTRDDVKARQAIVSNLQRRVRAEQDEKKQLQMLDRIAAEKQAIKSIREGKETADTLSPVNVGGAVGELGRGPFMSSDVFSFARSFGYKPRGRDFVRDIREQLQQATRFERDLKTLEKRGLPANVLREFRQQGISAAEEVGALAGADKGTLRQFGRLAAKREAVGERLQVGQMTAQINTAQIVIRNGRVTGIDRNGDGRISKSERFAVEAGARRA